MGRKVAERTVQSFLLGGLEDLDVEARAALVPSLQAATSTLATAGRLTTLVQTRRELKREVGTQIETSGLAVGELTTRVGAIAPPRSLVYSPPSVQSMGEWGDRYPGDRGWAGSSYPHPGGRVRCPLSVSAYAPMIEYEP